MAPVETPRLLVSIADLIDLFGYSDRWWRARVAEGLPCKRWGGRLRFSVPDVEGWLDERYG